jgi:hypothetical protein
VDGSGELRALALLVADGFTDPHEAPISTAFTLSGPASCSI